MAIGNVVIHIVEFNKLLTNICLSLNQKKQFNIMKENAKRT